MSSVLYLEQFLESLEPLPAELKKNFNEMRTMDEKVEMQKGLAESMGEVCRMDFVSSAGLHSQNFHLGV